MGLYGLPTRRKRALAPMAVGVVAGDIRYFRLNEGTTDGYETNAKLIPDPATHFDAEFELIGAIGSSGALLAQSRSTFESLREFEIGLDAGEFRIVVGGTGTATGITAIAGLWRFKFDGTNTLIYRNGTLLYTIATGAGGVTTAAATLSIAMSRAAFGVYEINYNGIIANVLIRNSSAVATNGYEIGSNTNDIPDTIGSSDASIRNGVAEDWALYQQQPDGSWVKQ
jgi:hypothetical protein